MGGNIEGKVVVINGFGNERFGKAVRSFALAGRDAHFPKVRCLLRRLACIAASMATADACSGISSDHEQVLPGRRIE